MTCHEIGFTRIDNSGLWDVASDAPGTWPSSTGWGRETGSVRTAGREGSGASPMAGPGVAPMRRLLVSCSKDEISCFSYGL